MSQNVRGSKLARRALGVAFLAGCWFSATAAAAPIANGTFESAPNADSANNTFSNWTENNGAAAVRATTPLAGSVSALLTGNSGQVGTLSQTGFDPITGTFDFGFTFAAVNPGGASASTNDRSLQLLLTSSQGAQINLIVIRGTSTSTGSVQVFGGSFQSIASQIDKVNFSPSLATPVLNTLRLRGTVGGQYSITTNGTESGTVNFYQAGTESTPSNFTTVNFTTVNAATVNYVVDNVTLVPEPAGVGLLGLVAVAGLARRRRVA